ncbi:MAG: hypothetical protein LC769_03750, partial [Chloroflexi bacterium]|nr:hypothetical protein [Chloroflexota bacterium]
VLTILLYQTRTAARARADRAGRFSARVRLDYRPRTTARVTLTVTLITTAPRGQFIRAMLVKITPPPLPKSGHVGMALNGSAAIDPRPAAI